MPAPSGNKAVAGGPSLRLSESRNRAARASNTFGGLRRVFGCREFALSERNPPGGESEARHFRPPG